MGYRHYGHRGFFFPPLGLLFGLFMLFLLFKTGLWIPLLMIGLIFWAMKHHHCDSSAAGAWGKRKRGPHWGGWYTDDDIPEKPKRDEYI